MRRLRCREYSKHGKSIKYLQIQAKFDHTLKVQISKYKDKLVSQVRDGVRGSIYPFLRKLGNPLGEKESNNSFEIPSHVRDNLSPLQCAERIASFFLAN